ncbi:MAG: hypothetical protein NWE87_07020 [Candidatus Bathyarchaeota archaeon]|nr:hypothetical protein [Candidatus Bathyarchaeota archaeon]
MTPRSSDWQSQSETRTNIVDPYSCSPLHLASDSEKLCKPVETSNQYLILSIQFFQRGLILHSPLVDEA